MNMPMHVATAQRYKPIQRADYDVQFPYKVDDLGYELCMQGACKFYAINYSGYCHRHGGKHGPQNLSRWEKLLMGFISVEDLDDEELVKGCTKTKSGKVVPRRDLKIPVDVYSKMVAELYKRHDERMRGMLDDCIDTMYDIMSNDAYEANDRMRAATWIFERIRGKAAETIKVEVDTAPWQDVLQGIAKITRSESRALREGTIEGEVVGEVEEHAVGAESGEVVSDGSREESSTADQPGSPTDTGDGSASPGTGVDDGEMGAQGQESGADSPEYVDLAHVPGTSEYAERQRIAMERAARIAERKTKIQQQRNRRYAARAQGHDSAEDAQPIQKGKRTIQPEDIKAPPEKPRFDRF